MLQPLLLTLLAAVQFGFQADPVDAELYTREIEGGLAAVVEFEIGIGWHLGDEELGAVDGIGKVTTVELSGGGVEWGPAHFPEPHHYEQPGFGKGGADTWIWVHEGTVAVVAVGEGVDDLDPDDVVAVVSGQVCDDDGSTCLPIDLELASAGPGPDELFEDLPAFGAVSEPSGSGSADVGGGGGPPGAGVENELLRVGLLQFLALAVFWGLFTLMMPCTYPMIPITISFFTKQAADRGKSALPLALAYGAGIVLVFIVIGVVFGSLIVGFATHPVTNLLIGLLFVFFALALFGVVNLEPPRFLMDAATKASGVGGYLGVFLMGTTLVVTSFTCTAPFVGSLLAVGAGDGNLGRIVLGMGTFGMTMAIPFFFLAMLPGKLQKIPRAGEWMHVLKVTLGFVELAAALKFISNADLVWGWGVLSRELFLVLWAGIAFVAALYLFAVIKLKDDVAEKIGPVRMVFATLAFLFALYCGYGMLGFRLDYVMTAIVPNYQAATVGGVALLGGGGERTAAATHIVKDDYDRALAQARDEGRALLVNFTGYT
jgi:cytochrome c biogenesis protein CcdA